MTTCRLIPMHCDECSRPWARTAAADNACPFCGARKRPVAREIDRLTSIPAGVGTPFDQALARASAKAIQQDGEQT